MAMSNEDARKRAETYIGIRKAINKPVNKDSFVFDYPGDKGDTERILYYIDLIETGTDGKE